MSVGPRCIVKRVGDRRAREKKKKLAEDVMRSLMLARGFASELGGENVRPLLREARGL